MQLTSFLIGHPQPSLRLSCCTKWVRTALLMGMLSNSSLLYASSEISPPADAPPHTAAVTANDNSNGVDDDVVFDSDTLRSFGLDTSLATQFRHGATFPEGLSGVTLTVNGVNRGRVRARFDDKGRLCPDAELLRQAGLHIPAGLPETAEDQSGVCVNLRDTWPQFTERADPADNTLALIVPAQALDPQIDSSSWQHNGVAGLLNYTTQALISHNPVSNMRYWQVQTEAGFNAHDWIIRSNQNVYHFGEETRADFQNAYAQRTFTSLKSTLTAGQIPLSGGLFGVGQVLGFQMSPEQGLYGGDGAAVVTGIANSPSVVEIRQLNIPIYHTTVPAGPFSLTGFNLLNTRNDLMVSVTGTDGSVQQYTVPSSSYARAGAVVTPGTTWGIGRYDQRGATSHPLVGVIARGFQPMARLGVQTGALVSADMQAFGLAFATITPWQTGISLQNTLSRTRAQNGENGHQGLLTSLTLSQPLADTVSVSLNASHQGSGYREFSETLTRDNEQYSRNKDQIGGGLTWSNALLGSFSLGAGRSTQTRGGATSWAQLSWGRQFGPATLNITASRNYNNNDIPNQHHEDQIYVSLSLPLGRRTSSTSTVSRSQGVTRYGTRINQQLSQDRNWSLSVDRNATRDQNSVGGTFNAVTPWTSLSGGLSADSTQNRSASLQTRGSLVVHSGGLTAAPYYVGDTFAIARVGKNGGIRIQTPAGPVWTNNKGYAVIPSLNSFQNSSVDIDMRTLGRRLDVVNGTREIAPARGSVSNITFDMVTTRRVLVSVKTATGQILPPGLAVYNRAGTFLTVTDDDGGLFLTDAHPGMVLSIEPPSGICHITLSNLPPEPPATAELYETDSAICR